MNITSKNNLKIPALKSVCRISALLLMVFFVYSAGEIYSNAKEFKQTRHFKKMNQTNKKEVAPGVWGGEGINLWVKDDGVKIQYDCAEAEITGKFLTDRDGNFSVEGTFTRHSAGAIRIGFEPKSQPAKFEGKITDKKMTLRVILTENEEKIGDYNLEHDKITRLHRCL